MIYLFLEVVVEEVGLSSDNESSIVAIPENSPMPNEILASDSLNSTSQILEETTGNHKNLRSKSVKIFLFVEFNQI